MKIETGRYHIQQANFATAVKARSFKIEARGLLDAIASAFLSGDLVACGCLRGKVVFGWMYPYVGFGHQRGC